MFFSKQEAVRKAMHTQESLLDLILCMAAVKHLIRIAMEIGICWSLPQVCSQQGSTLCCGCALVATAAACQLHKRLQSGLAISKKPANKMHH